MDDMGLGHPLGQFFTPRKIIFDDFYLEPGLLQHQSQINCGISAACNEYGMDRPFPQPQPLEHGADLRHGDDHGDFVPGLQVGVAAGDHYFTGALPNAHQHFASQHIVDGHHVLAVQRTAGGDLEADHVDLALGEGVHIQGRGDLQQTENVLCRRPFGVDDHGKTQVVLDIVDVRIIAGIPHPGNGLTVADLSGNQAGEHI